MQNEQQTSEIKRKRKRKKRLTTYEKHVQRQKRIKMGLYVFIGVVTFIMLVLIGISFLDETS
jgi:prepilin signal peptidase PulO-like enzyme (type II secretory pathway)